MTAPSFDPGPPPDSWDDLDDKSLVPTGKTARDLDKGEHARIDPRSQLSLGSGASVIETRNQVAMFKCDACRGSGRFVRGRLGYERDYGPCNKCKGTGKLKTSPEDRKKRKDAAVQRKRDSLEEYYKEHPAEWQWVAYNAGRGFGFARSMLEAVTKYGSWTPGQLGAIRSCLIRDEERKQQKALDDADAPKLAGTGFEKMLDAFARAKKSGLKNPKLHLGEFTFGLAGDRSRYSGQALFVRCGSVYCGRIDITTGRWYPVQGNGEYDAQVKRICQNPLSAAVMHGKQTGRCSCCNRELENEESVRLGIGPVCREKWGL